MFARTAARSLQFRSPHLQVALSPNHSRTFAKNNKPKRPQGWKFPHDGPANLSFGQSPESVPPRSQSTRGSAKADLGGSDRSGKPDLLGSLIKSEYSSGTGANATPASSPEPGATNHQTRQSTPPAQDSKLQHESQTSSKSDQSTALPNKSSSAIDAGKAKRQVENFEAEEINIPLPDLTKGIPSTIEAELAEAAAARKDGSIDVTRVSGRGERQMPASAYITSADRRRNHLMNYLLASMGLFILISPVYLGRNWESEEEELKHPDAPSGWGIGLFYNRATTRLMETMNYYKEPAYPRLPDPDAMYAHPYTLVLSLEDLLVHSEWTREHGWRTDKRPGVDYFVRYLSQYYELVLFTSVPSMIADPILRKLDPYRMLLPLFREATLYKNGEYIKDLSKINRPLHKVILLDTKPCHAKLQPENAIILPKWTGDPDDTGLVALLPFLEYLATANFSDTRDVLRSFEGKPIAEEFAAREAVARKKFEAQLAAEKSRRPKHSGVGFLGSALGIKNLNEFPDGLNLAEGFEQGKMLQDQIRERGQKQYELIDKEIRENGEKFLKESAEEEEKAKNEQMRSMKQGLTGWFGTKKEEAKVDEVTK